MYKKLSNLNVGDIFQYGDTIYEIVEKGVWHAKCKYINETPKSEYSPKYLFINFSLYTKVLNTFDHWSYGFDSRSGYN